MTKSKNRSFDYIKWKKIKREAQNASLNRKVFSIFGNNNALRRALIKRGWIEKIVNTNTDRWRRLKHLSQHSILSMSHNRNDYEVMIASLILQNLPSNFLWKTNNMNHFLTEFSPELKPFINRITRPQQYDFTRKESLINCVAECKWICVENLANFSTPRSYRLFCSNELEDFLDDFYETSCISLLKFMMEKKFELFSKNGTVSMGCLTFAINRISEIIHKYNHDEIDNFGLIEKLNSKDWNNFLNSYTAIVKKNRQFIMPENAEKELDNLKSIVTKLLGEVDIIMPRNKMDGFLNIWILKPGFSNCGIGIKIVDDPIKIIEYASSMKNKHYIVQKYLERPLLIYNTKFDIRQYFLLVTKSTSQQIWMYKQCYLKFSSKEFNLNDFHKSIHLTNHCVQKKYNVANQRNTSIPIYSMWSLEEFQIYLQQINQLHLWQSKIYSGMKQNICAAIFASQNDIVALQQNCFQLYGCDFMLTDEFEPILIEINGNPDLRPTTPITEVVCGECIEDVVKVVVDKTKNPKATTGNFEMIYELFIRKPPLHRINLNVIGTAGENKHKKKLKPPSKSNENCCNTSSSNEQKRQQRNDKKIQKTKVCNNLTKSIGSITATMFNTLAHNKNLLR